MENYAPIALFVYKRPEHVRETIKALAANPEFSDSHLFVYCDGPKHEKDNPLVRDSRDVVRSFSFPNVVMVERDQNFGLAESITTGVTELCNRYGRVIVLEDDLVVSSGFLNYMNRALDLYEKEEKVMQISGFMFPVELNLSANACFLPFTTSLGWATWQRAWKHFDFHLTGYEKIKKNSTLKKKFNLNGAYPYYQMVENQISGRVSSWAICFYLSVFLKKGLVLHPQQTFVEHTGFDGSGTHCRGNYDPYRNNKLSSLTGISKFPEVVEVDKECFDKIVKFLRKERHPLRILIKVVKRFFRWG